MNYQKLIEPDEVSDLPYIFVSYSRRDMQLVQEVLRILRKNRFRFWYDQGMKSGVEWAEELGNKIDGCDQFLVLISPNAIESKFVRKEVRMAVDRDKNMFVVYLEETQLNNALNLLLGDIHAIHRSYYRNDIDFESELFKSASKNTMYQSDDLLSANDTSGKAKTAFLENYDLFHKIGAGGTSQVYAAKHKRTGNIVAVKCGTIDDLSHDFFVRFSFYTEKRALFEMNKISCPNIPSLLDWYEDDSKIFLVESMIFGKTLWKSGTHSEQDTVKIAKEVLRILKYLHKNNILHRDIKPSNLIRDDYGKIHLVDFNIAFWKGDKTNDAMLGTRGYAAPEAYSGNKWLSYSSDLYSLGRTMEYLLIPDFFDKDRRFPVRYFRKEISVELEAFIDKMTAPDPKDRFQTASEALKGLANYKKISFNKKIVLYFKSWQRIKKVKAMDIEIKEKEMENINSIANYSKSIAIRKMTPTVIISNSSDDTNSTSGTK